jgi:hypothetical protein
MRRVAAVIAMIVALVAGCGQDSWEQTAPFAPSLRPAFGARVTDGDLQIWTGSPCPGATAFSLYFEPGEVELELRAPGNAAFDAEHLTVGGPYPGLQATKPLPADFDWRSADSVRISVYGGDGGWGSTAQIAEVIDGSADHPNDTYWFQDVGWLNPAQVAEQDGKTFLATCTDDPAQE